MTRPSIRKATLILAGVSSVFLCALVAQQPPSADAPAKGGGRGGRKGGGGPSTVAWTPKDSKPVGWVAPNKPLWKLADLLAKHKSKTDWSEPIVRDLHLEANYISMGPGKKTLRRMRPDTREWWVIQDGEIRFSIEGQEPFVATKGYLVQVPYRTMYTMETVGDKPSLRFEVNIAGARLMYALEETPPKVPGVEFIKTRVTGKGSYAGGNKPFIDFNAVVGGTETQRRFIADDRAVSNILLGDASRQAPARDEDKGHFHTECAEFWFILLGKMEYKMEGAGMIYADQGDIVYAPRNTWHRPRFSGEGPACRLAMNGFQDIGHMTEFTDSTGGQ